MLDGPIYLDHAATTPILPEVVEAMLPHFTTEYGNPSSVYGPGRRARHVVEKCRARVAQLIGAESAEIVFTSGGSEGNNTALFQARDLIVSSPMEHESVREPVRRFGSKGSVVMVTPDTSGRILPEAVRSALGEVPRHGHGLASFMLVNNEIGSLNPVKELASTLSEAGLLFHTDAVQAAGILDLTEFVPLVDYLTLSGHKIGAPKGIGILYVRGGAPYTSFIAGGSQEQERRAGTENVAFVVGITRALELASERRHRAVDTMNRLRSRMVDGLSDALPNQVLFNSPLEGEFAPHILNVALLDSEGAGLDGEMLILGLDMDGVYVSAGSACSSGTIKASPVLKALGRDDRIASGSIRISLSSTTSTDMVDRAVECISKTVNRMSSVRT